MPFVSVRTSSKLSLDKKEALYKGIGRIISILPGKAESNVMIEISDGRTMAFKGEEREGVAFCELRLYKPSPEDKKQEFVREFHKLLKDEAGISPDDVYMTIDEYDSWVSRGILK